MKVIPFGESETDAVVKTWLARKGIDPKDVRGYVIRRSGHGTPTIELDMTYDEEKTEQG